MARLACMFVPDWPLAALRRSEPELHGRPLVVVDRDDPRAPLLAVSPEARERGLRTGLSLTQARSLCEEALVRQITAGSLRAAQDALADVAESFSPRVEKAAEGTVLLDIDGLTSLFGSEGHLATSLAARTQRIGLDASIGIAGTRSSALLAARSGLGEPVLRVIPPGQEQGWLSPLPLAWLEPPAEIANTLERWGIRTLGELAQLPREAVGWRLGAAGSDLWRRARGEDESPLRIHARAPHFEEQVDCEFAIDSLEPLSFLLRGAIERLVTRLEVRGLRAGDLEVHFQLEDGGHEDRVVRVASPTVETRVLLTLVRLNLESRPPRAPVETFRLRAVPERMRPIALDLFTPAGPAPDELDAALARLSSLVGPDRVGAPATVDSHRPEIFALEPFQAGTRKPPEAPSGQDANAWSVLGLRSFRPPVSVEVVRDRGRPDFVQTCNGNRGPRPHGRVVAFAGPWRLQGEWWRDAPLARDYYDVEVSDGCVYRLYHEHGSNRWYATGVYD